MEKFKFKKIDAFATRKSDGNPAGMVYLDSLDNITTDQMQQIAAELKGFVSEVGYVARIDKTTFELKYYSAEREVDFCGHATIAIMYDVIKSNATLIEQAQLNIKTPKGTLTVENKIRDEDAVFISAPVPVFSQSRIKAANIARALKIESDEIDSSYPISVINAGLETLIVGIKSLAGIVAIAPQFNQLRAFSVENGIDIITLFSAEVGNKQHKYRTRVFAPTFGYLEDPATGSGNSALGYYLLKNDLWDGKLFSVEQNKSLKNPNIIKIVAKNPADNDAQVLFGGGAVVRIDGQYLLQ
jgi:PhzF family phenazine biosynthesis protein